jgi:tellurite resistance protein
MFSFLKGKAEEASKRLTGRTDALEAAGSAIALIAAADGSISDSEIDHGLTVAKSSKILSGAFTNTQIEEAVEKQLRRAGDRIGRAGLWREIDECAKLPADIRGDIFLIGVEVADEGGKGDIAPAERTVLKELASKLGVNPSSYGVTV